MTAERPLCVIIGALGGQGGGVLANWLAEAAHLAGYPAQSTSIPGVAQRTGATTYYFELFPEKNPAGTPVFSLFPSAGDVDLMAALEPTEAGRALERGFVTERTTVITSEARVYSTAEKSVAGDGALDSGAILESLKGAAKNVIRLEVANPFGREVNALAFGALISSGVLPLTGADAREAIRAAGLAVEANLASFETGLNVIQQPSLRPSEPPGVFSPPPPGFEDDLAAFPGSLRPLVGHALARLVDYQDEAYARRYLERLQSILVADDAAQGHRLTALVAGRLAAWMGYEDILRVAQLKTKPGRLARIRQEVAAKPGEPVTVEDFLSPSRDQLVEILPPHIARFLPGGTGSGDPFGRHLRWRTFSPFGFVAMRFLAALKPLRPRAAGFAKNQQAIETWLAVVRGTARVDYALACDVAGLAVWARGYGNVRARGLSQMAAVLKDWPDLLKDTDSAKQRLAASLRAARATPDL
jgi:indolepyruvate ferredoxin oxidoreductase beta subunit